jgi:regulator of nucleoside diphosphate kinase
MREATIRSVMKNRLNACPCCRFANPPDAGTCLACGTTLAAGATPERPLVWITTEDFRALRLLAHQHRRGNPAVCDFLLGELNRAIICAPDWIPDNVVTMNSRVAFRASDARSSETRMLVFPDRYDPAGQALSVLTPLGAALLGLAAGSGIEFRDRQGETSSVQVDRVIYQPEAARRRFGSDEPPPPAA